MDDLRLLLDVDCEVSNGWAANSQTARLLCLKDGVQFVPGLSLSSKIAGELIYSLVGKLGSDWFNFILHVVNSSHLGGNQGPRSLDDICRDAVKSNTCLELCQFAGMLTRRSVSNSDRKHNDYLASER